LSATVLAAQGIFAGYGGEDVVKDATVVALEGQLTVLLGPNGAGKSTLMKAIIGLIPRSAGRLMLRGQDASTWSTDRMVHEGVSYVPQLQNVFPSLTVTENLEVGAYRLRAGVGERVSEMLDLFPDLRKATRRPARTLSGGERSLLALARGLMTRPFLLLVDEPTAGLSPKNELAVWEHLDLIRQSGIAVLVVEQNVKRALQYADVGYVLVLGATVLKGPPSDLLGDRLTALYIGKATADLHQASPDTSIQLIKEEQR
jgi:ABC-type branched-subunit amino acid transport system ATPase component